MLSTTIAIPWPPPMQAVASPVLFLASAQFVQQRDHKPRPAPSTNETQRSPGGHAETPPGSGSKPGSPPTSTTSTLADLGGTGSSDGGGSTTLTGTQATAPSAPTGISAIPGNGQVTVSWVTPDDGGSPITAYVVTTSVGGVIQALTAFSSSATSQVIVGLTNGTAYSFTVAATNAVGTSSPSTPSPEVSPIAPTLSIINGRNQGRTSSMGDKIIVTFFARAVAQCLLRLLERHVVS